MPFGAASERGIFIPRGNGIPGAAFSEHSGHSSPNDRSLHQQAAAAMAATTMLMTMTTSPVSPEPQYPELEKRLREKRASLHVQRRNSLTMLLNGGGSGAMSAPVSPRAASALRRRSVSLNEVPLAENADNKNNNNNQAGTEVDSSTAFGENDADDVGDSGSSVGPSGVRSAASGGNNDRPRLRAAGTKAQLRHNNHHRHHHRPSHTFDANVARQHHHAYPGTTTHKAQIEQQKQQQVLQPGTEVVVSSNASGDVQWVVQAPPAPFVEAS